MQKQENFRLPDRTRKQINDITRLTGMTRTQVVILAINDLQKSINKEREMRKSYEIDGWTYDLYVSEGVGIIANIKSPKGFDAMTAYLGIDDRLSQYGTEANIDFASSNLELTESQVSRLITAVNMFIDHLDKIEPEHSFVRA